MEGVEIAHAIATYLHLREDRPVGLRLTLCGVSNRRRARSFAFGYRARTKRCTAL